VATKHGVQSSKFETPPMNLGNLVVCTTFVITDNNNNLRGITFYFPVLLQLVAWSDQIYMTGVQVARNSLLHEV
jgi:hypothetical protein